MNNRDRVWLKNEGFFTDVMKLESIYGASIRLSGVGIVGYQHMEFAMFQGNDVASMRNILVGIDHHFYCAALNPYELGFGFMHVIAGGPTRIITDNIAHHSGSFACFKMHAALGLEEALVHGSSYG